MCLALARLHGFSVDVHGGSYVGMAHQFLLHLERSPSLVQTDSGRCGGMDPALAEVLLNWQRTLWPMPQRTAAGEIMSALANKPEDWIFREPLQGR